MSERRVLVVEAEPAARRAAVRGLEQAGFSTVTAERDEVPEWVASERLALVVLGTEPGPQALATLREIRAVSTVPLILTGELDQQAVSQALEVGADDYLPVPYSPQELGTRVRAMLWPRPEPSLALTGLASSLPPLGVGPLWLDPRAGRAHLGSRRLPLPPRQLRLLYLLAMNVGRPVPQSLLIAELSGPDEAPVELELLVTRLQISLAVEGLGELIHRVNGGAYLLSSELESYLPSPPGQRN